MNKLILLFLVSLVFSNVYSAEIGIPVQFRMKAPDGSLPNESGLTIQVQVLSPNGCILRDESFSSQSIIDGVVSVNLGNGVEGGGGSRFFIS